MKPVACQTGMWFCVQQQKQLVAGWIRENGADKTLSSRNLRETTQRLIKETVKAPTEIKFSKELERPSPFRPRIENSKNVFPGVSFSNYYYENSQYCVRVYYNGVFLSTLELGPDLPSDSIISVTKVTAEIALEEQVKWLLKYYTKPSTVIEATLNYNLGDNPITTLPAVAEAFNKIDSEAYKIAYEWGDILIQIYTEKRIPQLSRQDTDRYELRTRAIIERDKLQQ